MENHHSMETGQHDNTNRTMRHYNEGTTNQIKMPNQMVEPSIGKRSKDSTQTKNTKHNGELQQGRPHDNAIQILFHRQECTDSDISPLQEGTVKLPLDPAGMKQYCPGQNPLEQPGYTLI